MLGTIRPDVVRAAIGLRRSHPQASALAVRDMCLHGCAGRVADFGPGLVPPAPFALLVAEAFDRGMTPDEWRKWWRPPADAVLVSSVLRAWRMHVLPSYAAAYGLTP